MRPTQQQAFTQPVPTRPKSSAWLFALAMLCPFAVMADTAITLPHLLKLLQSHNPSLAVASARQESAQGALDTANAYPNPEVEVLGGT